MSIQLISHSEKETTRLGTLLGEHLVAGDVVCLDGDLGTGKTAFAKGIAAGLGVKEPITSPTFTLVNTYHGRLILHHFDIYRVDDLEELFAIGFEEYMDGEAVTLIEWAEKLDTPLNGHVLHVLLTRGEELDSRKIVILGAPNALKLHFQGEKA